jgi:preprotein translocase subunit SecA
MIDDVVTGYVGGATAEGFPEEWDLDKLWRALRQLYPVGVTVGELEEEAGGERAGLSREQITESITQDAHAAYDRRTEELTPEIMREMERRVVLAVLDRKWREHLYEMDYLREGVSLRGYGQRDPLIEYQREGYDMFTAMMDGIKEESVASLFNFQLQPQEPIMQEAAPGLTGNGAPPQAALAGPATQQSPPVQQGQPRERQPAAGQRGASAGRHRSTSAQGGRQASQPVAAEAEAGLPAGLARGAARPQRGGGLSYSAPSEDATGHAEHKTVANGDPKFANVGRNAPCPCGSGRKFKQCHGDPRTRQ